MDIYNSNGVKLEYSEVLANLPITESCEHVEELMKADHIVLSWRDSEKYTLPVGAYITYKGVNYALLEPYEPEQKSGDEFEYTPNFQHPKMYLGKVPFRFPTTDTEGNSITLLEWPYSGDIDTLLTFFCRTMESELGLTANTFNYSILGEIDMVVSTTFNAVDILSALSNVANQLKCEWHIDWDYKILYFGHIELSRDEVDETVLEVGVNVGTPSVRSSKEGFYNTYEPQGSTRNISKRAASGEYVQGDVRLALNVEDYPDKVIYTNESGTVIASLPQGVKKYVKPLIFDNIYPKLDLYVYDVRCRERDLLDDNGEKIIDHYNGSTPVYKRYAVWYMRLAYPTKVDGHVTAWTDYTINPETDIISGKNLGGAFQPNNYNGAESFPLVGRGNADDGGYGFELNYHTTAETIPASGDDTGVIIKAGDYEIVFQQQNDYILPTTASQGIIPKGVKVNGQEVTDLNGLTNLDDGQKGNIVDLYNIVIGSAYTESAQDELANETLKYITNQFKDNNSYTLKSDVVAFKKRIDQDELLHTDSSLYIGEKVIYKNGDYELETRVMKLVTKLDYAFVQEITVGNEVLKGSTTTLKEQVQTILSGGVGNGSGGGGIDAGAVRKIVQAYANPRFLSKLNDDTAQGFITMLKGLQVGANFVPDILGEGGCLRMRQDGKVELVTDILYARMRAYFDSVVIREYRHESGNRIKSPAQGFNASRVENIKVVEGIETIVDDASEADFFRCYWRVDDGEKKAENQFVIGDLAFCEHTEVVDGTLETKRYWRVVRGRNAGNTTTADGEAWIDLSNAHDANGNPVMTTISWAGQGGTTQTLSVKSFESGTNNYPEAHDDICMLGCVVDTTRQGAIIEYVSGVNAPTYQIYQGLGSDATNPYTLSNKNQITIGYNSATGKADMKVYGDAYIGDRNRSTYIEYKQDDGTPQHRPVLNIKANVTFTNTSEMSQFVKDNQNNYDDTAILNAIGGLEATTEDLQRQIDGAIETWFMTGVPTLNNAPANEWTTDDEKDKHIGDLYYNKATGHGYRFMYDDENDVYLWVELTDEDVTEALRIASEAQETADGKMTIYSTWGAWMKNNVNTLQVGDLFIPTANTTQGSVTYKANKVYKCTADGQATFQAADYIDDAQAQIIAQAKVQAFVNGTYATDKINLQSQIDGKAETFRQATDPSSSWTATDKPKHVGDLWMDISDDGGKKTYIYEDKGESADPRYDWEAQEVPDEVFDEIDGKSTIFGNAVATPPTNYKKDDMWLLPAAATINGVSYKAGDVLSASQDSETYSAAHWSKKLRYTDDTKADSILNNSYYQQLAGGTINSLIGEAQSDADAAANAAAAAQLSATAANTKLTNWADDGKISPTEKLALKNQKTDVQKEYAQIIADAAKYSGVSTTAFTTAYNRAITAFNYYTSTSTENIDIITDEEEDSDATPRYSRIAAYYAARQTILEAMTTAAKSYATSQGDKFLNDAVYKAISAALGSKTDIVGGLVLTSLIGMRQQNGGGTYTVWGGISGEYDDWSGETHAKGHGIAAWYGGELLDKETLTAEQIADGWNGETYHLRWAKSVDRFDGSGYRADGNISWDENGALTIKNITTLSDSNNNNILNELATFNSAFTFGTSGQGSTTALYITPNVPFQSLYIGTSNANKKEVATKEWVGNNYVSTAFFRQLFRAFKPNETAGQDDVEVQPNTIDATISNIKAMVDFWSQGGITALGRGSGGGGGGATTLYGLNDVTPNATGDGVMGAQDGYVLTYNGTTNHWYAAATAETYVLPTATAAALGGIKIGYTTSGKNYAVQLSNGQAFVNVPWTDTLYTLTKATSSALGGLMLGYTESGKNYAIQLDTDGKAYVNVPWENTWRGIQDNLTSDSTTDSLSAAQGKALKGSITTLEGYFTSGVANSAAKLATARSLWGNSFDGTSGITSSIIISTPKANETEKYLQIGDIKMVYDSENEAIYVVHSDDEKVANFYAQGGVSALGSSSGGGGGGVNMEVVWANLAASTSEQINASHLSTALSGYATQSWVSNTLSPYATQSWVNTQLGSYLPLTAGSSKAITGVLYTNKIINLGTALDNAIVTRGINGASSDGTLDNLYINHGHYGHVYICYGSGNGGSVLIGYAENAVASHKLKVNGSVYGSSFVKSGGTSSQFLKADGSVDSNSYVTSSGVTSVATGTGLTGGTITSTGTISINSTYQTYISHGESAYNSLGNYLPLTGGTMTGFVSWGNNWKSTSGGWNIKDNGIGVLSSTVSGSGAPYAYSVGLHVGGAYWFQLSFDRGNNRLNYRGGNSDTTWGWYHLIDSNNIGSQSVAYATSAGSATVASKLGNYYTENFIVFGNNNENYVDASFPNLDYSAKAHQKYIEFWDGGGRQDTGWYNFRIGKLEAVDGVFVSANNTFNPVIHSGNIGSQSVNYATSAGKATNDSDGNAINSTYLKKSGGTMTGALGKSSNYLIKPVADYRTTSDTHTGCIAITLPATIGSTMVSMWIDVYNYLTNTSFSVHCGGYTYNNSTWANSPFAMVYGASHRVRLGHNGTSFVIYIGETNSTWHYPQVTVRDVVLGYAQTYANWYKDWTISFVTSVSNVTADYTRYAITSSNIGSQSVNYATTSGSCSGNAATATNADKLDGYHATSFMSFSDNPNYVDCNFVSNDLAVKAREKYIEFYQGGWFNFTLGGLTTVSYAYLCTGGGNCGVNTSNPRSKFDVYGGTSTFGGNGVQTPIQITRAYNDSVNFTIGSAGASGTNTALDMRISNNGSGGGSTVYIDLMSGGGGVYISPKLSVGGTTHISGQVGIATAVDTNYYLKVGGPSYIGGTLTTNKIINLGDAGTNAIVTRGLNGANANGTVGDLYINNGHNGNVYLCYGGGNVGIGNMSASYKLHVSGDIYATGGVTAASDARMKDVVGNTDLNVEQVANAPAVRFYWKKDHSLGEQVGTLAQYWQNVLPQSVSDKSGELSLQYGVAALISSITIARKVVNHEKRITELERECERLRTENEQLKLKIA